MRAGVCGPAVDAATSPPPALARPGRRAFPAERTLPDRLRSQYHVVLAQLGLPELLRYEDRNTMDHSLEGRVPFLDHRLVELLYGLPATELYNEGSTKLVLRRALTDLLPPEVRDRKDKLGFVTPEQRFHARRSRPIRSRGAGLPLAPGTAGCSTSTRRCTRGLQPRGSRSGGASAWSSGRAVTSTEVARCVPAVTLCALDAAAARPRLLVFNQYYYPGLEATAHLLELCEHLATDYSVTVITGRLYGREDPDCEVNGVEIIRLHSTS